MIASKNQQNQAISNIEIEYEIVTILADQRWKLQLAAIDDQLKQYSHHFYVADDGLVEVGLGVFC